MREFFINKKTNKWINTRHLNAYLESLQDGRYVVKVQKTNKRSSPQNRYYWGLVIPLIKDAFINLGHEVSDSETHEFLKAKFNGREIVNTDTGEVETLPMSTTRLSKDEFVGYVDSIQRWAATFLQLVIPDPGEQLEAFK